MKIVVIASALLAAAACAPPAKVEQSIEEAERQAEAAVEDIEEAATEWADAFRTKDPDRLAVLYTPNAVLLPLNEPLVVGDEAIEEWAEGQFADATPREVSVTTDEIQIADDWAWRRGHFRMTLQPPDGELVTARGKFLEIWERQADGSWKIARDIWNMDAPAPEAS